MSFSHLLLLLVPRICATFVACSILFPGVCVDVASALRVECCVMQKVDGAVRVLTSPTRYVVAALSNAAEHAPSRFKRSCLWLSRLVTNGFTIS